MKDSSLLDEFHLQEFQKRTVQHAYARMFENGQRRFLIADEVGLGKTKVAQGVIAMATARRPQSNVVYLASSGHIVAQNLKKLKTSRLTPESFGSLSLLAEKIYQQDVRGKLIGLTPIKDLRDDHFGSVHERVLLYKLLMRRYRSLMLEPDVRAFFKGNRVSDQTFNEFAEQPLPSKLRDAFERKLKSETIIEQLKDPQLRKKHKRAIVGRLRAVLARCALEKLSPALIVVDEIQRFSGDLIAEWPTPQVEYLLERRMLVLSATPYQPGAPGDDSGKNPHKGFMDLVGFLNCGQASMVQNVQLALAEMRSALREKEISKAVLQLAVDNLGNHLRDFMVRTERPFDAHVQRIAVEASMDERDLTALRQAIDLLRRADPSAKNKRHRFAELVDLWKSTPYVISALSARYVTGRAFAEAVGKRLPVPAALTSSQLNRKAPLVDPAHPRLRAMMKEMGTDAKDRRLWLPPTRPYVENPSRSLDNPPSKTLVFTSWSAAPPAIATALNLCVEPRPSREKDLEFSRVTNAGQKSMTVRSVYLISAPLWRFAESSDPFEAMRGSGKALPASKLISEIRKQLEGAGHLKVSRAARPQNLVDVALGLNAGPLYPKPSVQTASYLVPARDLMNQVQEIRRADVTVMEANELAELAAGAPGTCAYRALRRAIPGDTNREALFGAAIAIGYSISRLFQRPAAVAVVEGGRSNKKKPYWRRVISFCLENDLQSVLDEYVFLLVRDSLEKDPERLANEVAEAIHVALSTVGGLHVARPRAGRKSQYGAAMYARALGEHDSPPDDDPRAQKAADKRSKRPARRRGRHANPLLTAFNSPFPPFVLATTSTGQEGLDMHRYCRRLVHWNLPTSPLALEQREGRVDRYLSLGVRTSIAKLNIPANALGSTPSLANPWELLVQAAREQSDKHNSILAPLWHYGEGQPIKAIALNIPFSREETAWARLLEEASWYRLVLGQPDPHALLERLSNSSEKNRREINGVRLDLAPP
ncbi:DEAD/DEAH box helicase family protein [Pandoraea commovens]|uniref:DEAD/DEAH box helicase family protein n=1 Tax=Pandoraea commovens TaxID=2508289 RepID=A0ABY5QFL5_9BURK|nr:DEAD/DEAH box helicase family protein [Pandoraea commovens]UVA79571.1 DEAD/DEAH box helicase family protein [Pandoraea commovens]